MEKRQKEEDVSYATLDGEGQRGEEDFLGWDTRVIRLGLAFNQGTV